MPTMTVRTSSTSGSLLQELDRIVDSGDVSALFQPIVDLETAEVVGYEALARGPKGSSLELPAFLLEAGRRSRRVAELDWLCRGAAVVGAMEAGLAPPFTLFVNVEPDALHKPVPQRLKPTWLRAKARLRIMLEVTERALTTRPTELLWSVQSARELGWGVALDDVGADPRSLALLPFLRPDVVKLDLHVLRDRPRSEVAKIVNAVAAECERSGAAVLAEGIETDRQLATARAMGARLGQGWLLGRPQPMPAQLPERGPRVAIAERAFDAPVGFTPFDIISKHRPVGRGDKRILQRLSRSLEIQAAALPEAPVVLSAFQDERFFTPATAELYASVARRSALVAAFAAAIGPAPAEGVRGARLFARDPLRGEWVVVVVGAHFAAALAARDLGDDAVDEQRRFDYVLSYDRELVIEVAGSLMARVIAL